MIEIREISRRFGNVQALQGATLTIPRGEVTGLVGPNGAGKTTLLRIVAGLDSPDAGSVLIDGQEGMMRHRGPSVAAMLDPNWVYGRRTAIDHLWMLAAAHGKSRGRALEMLDAVGLGSVAKARVQTFSLGMRQRLGIGACLISDAQSILLDEPANGLDPEGIRWMRGLTRSLASRGHAVLISSHLLNELAMAVDRIVVIAGGRIRAEGRLADVLSEAGECTLADSDDLPLLESVCRGAGAEVRPGERGLAIKGLRPGAVSRLACANGVLLTHLEAKSATLEERYVALTTDHAEFRSGSLELLGRGGEPS